MIPPKLKPLHNQASLNRVKLDTFRRLETQRLVESLTPGTTGALKTRPDGTVLDGHHRIAILAERGVDVDALPREILSKVQDEGSEAL
jgi:hypothetical protein